MNKKKVVFICIHNSGRSQIAQAYLKKYAGDRFQVESAGIEAGILNPLVVLSMEEVGVKMDGHFAKKADSFLAQENSFDYVITVCDETNAERCPVFPGKHTRIHWNFPDPSALSGTVEEKLKGIRTIRDSIENKILEWIKKN